VNSPKGLILSFADAGPQVANSGGRRQRSTPRSRRWCVERVCGQIKERLEVGTRDAQRIRVTPEAMNLDCLASKTLHCIVLRESGRVFGDERVMPLRLVKVTRDAVCRSEREKRVERLADVLEIQELCQEGK